MNLDESHILNKKVLEYIIRGKKKGSISAIAKWDSVAKPYMEQGSHPDVVERVWDVLGSSLPEDCRCLVYGTPALVHPKTGIILVFCNGTSYCIRLTEQLMEKALKAGAKTYQTWTYGGDMDTLRDLGSDWVFGWWLDGEIEWCRTVYEDMGKLKT
jgi:hypothetical protein